MDILEIGDFRNFQDWGYRVIGKIIRGMITSGDSVSHIAKILAINFWLMIIFLVWSGVPAMIFENVQQVSLLTEAFAENNRP